MTLNYIWWWGSNSGDLESVEYTFIAIRPRFTLTQGDCICYGSQGQIDQFKDYLYSMDCVQTKTFLRNTYTKNVTINMIH